VVCNRAVILGCAKKKTKFLDGGPCMGGVNVDNCVQIAAEESKPTILVKMEEDMETNNHATRSWYCLS